MSELSDSIETIRRQWPSLAWPLRLLYASVPLLILTLLTIGGWAVSRTLFPSHVPDVGEEPLTFRMPSEVSRQELVRSLRGLPPENFTLSRTLSSEPLAEFAANLRADLLSARWKDDSGILIVGDAALGPGITVRMKMSPPAGLYLLNWLNRQGLQARGLADVPKERTYDVAVEIGPLPRGESRKQ